MGFGGAALAANQAVRNNRNLLKNKRRIGKLSFVSDVDEKWVDPKKATFDQLMRIRKKIRDQNVSRKHKVIIVTIILLCVFALCTAIIPWEFIFTNVH